MAEVGPTGARALVAFRSLGIPAKTVGITAGTDTWVAPAQFFYCATAGDLVYTPADQTATTTLTGIVPGFWHAMAIKAVTSFSGTGPVIGWIAS